MKKILTSLLLVIGLLFLVSCEDNQELPTDTTKPVIVGADPKTITVGDTFDPLEGVTASDDVDGTIILTLDNVTGTVNNQEPGTYTLTYKVTDSAGNEAVKQRVITVVAEAPLANLIGGDFERESLGAVPGWETWFDEGSDYDVDYQIVDGVLEIDIKDAGENDTQWWAVQVSYKKLMLEPFVSYKLVFKVKADEERYMNHQIQGGGLPGNGKAYDEYNFLKITTEWQTVEQEFYVKGDGVDSELQFSFGNYAEDTGVPADFKRVLTKVYLDDVRIVEGPELVNQKPTLTAPNLIVKTGTPTAIKQGISVIDDFTDLTVADVLVTQKTGEPVFDPQNPAKGVYTFDVEVEDEEGLKAQETRTITVADPWNQTEEFGVVQDIHGWDLPEDEGWYIRQIDVENDELWLDYTDNENGEVSIKILEIPDGDFQAAYRLPNLQFFAGTYTISFEIKADAARELRSIIEQSGLPNEEALQHIEVTTDWTTVTLEYTFNDNQFNKALEFWFGSLTTDRGQDEKYEASDDILTTIYFKNLNVVYTELAD